MQLKVRNTNLKSSMLLSPIFVLQNVSLDKFKQEEDKAQKTNPHIDLKI